MSSFSFSSSNSRSNSHLHPRSHRSPSEELEHSELCRRLQVMGIEVAEVVPKIGRTSTKATKSTKSKEGKPNKNNPRDEGYCSRSSTISSLSTTSNAPVEQSVRDNTAAKMKLTFSSPKQPTSPPVLVLDVPDNWLSDFDNEAGKEQQQRQLFVRTTTLRQRRKRFSLAFDLTKEAFLSGSDIFEKGEEDEPYEESETLIQKALPRPLPPFDKLRRTLADHTGMHFIFSRSKQYDQKRWETTNKKLQKQRRQSVTADLCYWQMLIRALKDAALL